VTCLEIHRAWLERRQCNAILRPRVTIGRDGRWKEATRDVCCGTLSPFKDHTGVLVEFGSPSSSSSLSPRGIPSWSLAGMGACERAWLPLPPTRGWRAVPLVETLFSFSDSLCLSLCVRCVALFFLVCAATRNHHHQGVGNCYALPWPDPN